MALRLVLLVIVAGVLAIPASAGNGAFAFQLEGYEKDSPVEQQSWPFYGDPTTAVYNNTDCIWSSDDSWDYLGYGYLNAGVKVGVSKCEYADWVNSYSWMFGHDICVRISSSSPSLDVRLSFSPGPSVVVPSAINTTSKGFVYIAYLRGPSYQEGDPAFQLIPNSNGGIGVPTTMSVTLANNGSKRVQNTTAIVYFGGTATQFCGR